MGNRRHDTAKATRTKNAISKALDSRLFLYALTAGTTLTAAQTANAEVRFTPSNAVLQGYSGSFAIDLDHDGSADVTLIIRPVVCCSGYGSAPGLVASGDASNQIATRYRGADPLNRTARIEKGQPFHAWAIMTSAIGYGAWQGGENKFLGVRFLINGNFHYGWIGFRSVTLHYPVITANLAGWAYETEPNKSILAGDIGTAPPLTGVLHPTSMEILAAGHSGIDERRKRTGR